MVLAEVRKMRNGGDWMTAHEATRSEHTIRARYANGTTGLQAMLLAYPGNGPREVFGMTEATAKAARRSTAELHPGDLRRAVPRHRGRTVVRVGGEGQVSTYLKNYPTALGQERAAVLVLGEALAAHEPAGGFSYRDARLLAQSVTAAPVAFGRSEQFEWLERHCEPHGIYWTLNDNDPLLAFVVRD